MQLCNLEKSFGNKRKQVAVLIDPGKEMHLSVNKLVQLSEMAGVDYFFVGGSLVNQYADKLVEEIKNHSKIPVILFPGSVLQITSKADGILLLSLISGRNPEYLIGHHVISAPILKQSKLQIIPTGYILIDSGKTTSVEYISNTQSIPRDKDDIAVATAIAGEMLGLRQIYLDAGSGAKNMVPIEIIEKVKKNIDVPLIVGGGIRSKADALEAFSAGADIIVIGNITEHYPEKVSLIIEAATHFN